MRRGLTATSIGWLLLLAPPALASDQDVGVGGFSFTPSTVHVDPGDTVTWTYSSSDRNHSVTADAGQAETWDSDPSPGPGGPDHTPGYTFQHTFTTVGTYTYFCKVHASMHGTVVVGNPPPPADPDPDPTPTPSPTPDPQPTPSPSQSPSPSPAPAPPQPSAPTPETGQTIFQDTRPPAIAAAKLRKTTLTYQLDEAADVAGTLKLSKAAHGAKHGTTSMSLTQKGRKGANKLKLSTRGLRAGSYKLTLRATDAAGNRSKPTTLKLTVR